jgi:peptidoglycan/xylan/chitin deacetylase (PgdA/CDA1 family)
MKLISATLAPNLHQPGDDDNTILLEPIATWLPSPLLRQAGQSFGFRHGNIRERRRLLMQGDRRDFLRTSLTFVGAAGLTAVAPVAHAQTGGRPLRRSNRYDDSIISERKPFVWPGNKTLAVWIAPNVEVWNYDAPEGQAVSPNTRRIVPDVINYAWREYGLRVGLWRIADVLDAAGVKATIALNALVCEHYPKAVEEMKKRGWEFMGHGTTNSESLAGLSPEKERETIALVLKTIEQSTGARPRGWLGSGLAETYNTLDILAEEGVLYCGDWNADDQPFPLKVKSGKLYSIPYCMEINDIGLYNRKGYTGEQYYRSVMDQFETLYAESEKQPRVMGIPLHPMISGQPLRIKYLQRLIAEMKSHDRVWFATGSEIIDAYLKVA